MSIVRKRTTGVKAKQRSDSKSSKQKRDKLTQGKNRPQKRSEKPPKLGPHPDDSEDSPKEDEAPRGRNLLERQRDPIKFEPEDDGCEHESTCEANDPSEVPKLRAWLKEENGVYVPRLLRQITSNGDQAIILAQILYWFDKGKNGKTRATAMWDGERFVAKSHKEFAIEVGMTARHVKACLAALRKDRLIRTDYHLWDGHKTSFIQPVVGRIEQELEKVV